MEILRKKKRGYFLLILIFLILLVYSFQDIQTSRNLGADRGVSRLGVYLSLFSLITILGVYFLSLLTQQILLNKKLSVSPVQSSLVIISLWILFVNIFQRTNIWVSAVHFGLCTLWFLLYNFFSNYLRRNPNAFKSVKKIIFLMFIFYVFSAIFASHLLRDKFGRIVAVNLSYHVLVFLPWLFMMELKIRRLAMALVILVLLFSMKRGAILVFPLMLVASILIETKIKREKTKPPFKIIMIIFIFLCGLFVADSVSGGFLSERFSPENLVSGSGRASIYLAAIENIKKETIWNLLVGGGSGYTLELLGISAHNEWLEFLINFGLIGSILYFSLLLSLFKEMRRYVRSKSPFAPGCVAAIVYILVVGMFGQIFFAHSTIYLMAFLGAANGLRHKNCLFS